MCSAQYDIRTAIEQSDKTSRRGEPGRELAKALKSASPQFAEDHEVGTEVERRLAAILAADVAGYSRMMEADESATLARLKAHMGEFVRPKIAAHRGTVVKTTGDGFLAEFASVIEAVECAVEIQRAMAEANVDVPDDRENPASASASTSATSSSTRATFLAMA